MTIGVGQTEEKPENVEDAVRKIANNEVEFEYKDLLFILKGTEDDLERIRSSFVSWETFFISQFEE